MHKASGLPRRGFLANATGIGAGSQVKAPGASTGDWDFYDVLATIPGAQAFRPLSEGGCRLS